jgi:hypothetical protein
VLIDKENKRGKEKVKRRENGNRELDLIYGFFWRK